MSKQTSLHPDALEEALRGSKRRKRDRPWLLQQRASEEMITSKPRFSLRWREWWTAGRYETEEQAKVVKAKNEREWAAHMWELRIVNEDEPRGLSASEQSTNCEAVISEAVNPNEALPDVVRGKR